MSDLIQIPLDRDYVFRWEPDELPDETAPITAKFTVGDTTHTATLVNFGPATINSVPDSSRLYSGASSAAATAGLVGEAGGRAWLYLAGHGPLREPMAARVPTTATGSLTWNFWHATVPADTFPTVNRAGRVTIKWTPLYGAANPGRTKLDHIRVRAVRNPFSVGLTSDRLEALVPQLAHVRPSARESWAPTIKAIDLLAEVERHLPRGAYADQTIGEQWRKAAALYVAAHLADQGLANLDAEAMREIAAAEFAHVADSLHWLDSDDDGAVGDGEVAVAARTVTGLTRSSAAATRATYADGTRHRPALNDPNDR